MCCSLKSKRAEWICLLLTGEEFDALGRKIFVSDKTFGKVNIPSMFLSQLESLLHLWLTLSLNAYSCGSEDAGGDIFLFNSCRVPTIPLNQGQSTFWASSALMFLSFSATDGVNVLLCSASIGSFLTVLSWYPNTSLRTWCLVLRSLTLMTNMPANGQSVSPLVCSPVRNWPSCYLWLMYRCILNAFSWFCSKAETFICLLHTK